MRTPNSQRPLISLPSVLVLLLAGALSMGAHGSNLQDPVDPPPAPDEEEVDDEDEPDEVPQTFQSMRDRINAELTLRMQGVWTLTELQQSTTIETDTIVGYATILDNYISMVIHAVDTDAEIFGTGFNFQATVSTFELRDDGVMYCASMIGHSNFSGVFEPELRGFPRIYRVEASEFDLQLIRSDGARLIFRRMQPGYFPQGASDELDDLRNDSGG